MTSQQENSNKMDQSGNYRTEPEENRLEVNPNESQSAPVLVTSLDNLISDCLEMIFRRLDLNSLLSVAGTCKQLQIEATAVVEEKYDLKKVILYHNFGHSPYIHVARKQEVKGLKSCLAFLRCFGDTLTELSVQWHTWAAYKFIDPIDIPKCKCLTILDQYINQYCNKSLSTIKFCDKPEFSNENYVYPFVNVHTIHLDHCGIGQQLPRFTDWFPNLRYLDINPASVHQLSVDMQLHFPNLQHLTIRIFKDDQHRMGIEKLLRMNPQLQSLEIHSSTYITMNQFLNMISGNPSLLKVTTKSGFSGSVDRLESMRLLNEHPSIVELNIDGYKFEVMDAINLVSQLNLLKTIGLRFESKWDRMRFVQQLTSEWEEISGLTYTIKINRK